MFCMFWFKGKDWAAWAVPDKKGRFMFNKKTYDNDLAWARKVQGQTLKESPGSDLEIRIQNIPKI